MKAMLARDATVPAFRRHVLDWLWAVEPKYDGIRTLVHLTKGPRHGLGLVTWTNRNGAPLTKPVPESVTRALEQTPGDLILDGELVDGKLYAFDLPRLGHDLFSTQFVERRATLEQVLDLIGCIDIVLVPSTTHTNSKERMLLQAAEEGWEGVILKDQTAPYQPGVRSQGMLKLKFTRTIDCIVTTLHSDGKENAHLSLVEDVYAVKRLKEVGRCSLVGKEEVGLHDVIEVRFLYVGSDGHLVQPRMLRRRTDKSPEECTIDQLDGATLNQPVR